MEPIIALASARVKSAIHIIRISGDNIFDIVSSFFTKDIKNIKEKQVFLGSIKTKERFIDQVVVIAYPHPNSYTGEDVIEIMCHGSPLISDEIIKLFIESGVRMATNGEFTSRAFLNHKMDLVEAEAVNDVINATTLEGKRIAANSLLGETSKLLDPIKKGLLDLISNIEVNIDYPEYKDIEIINKERIDKDLIEFKRVINTLIKDGESGLIIKEGIKIAIVGKPNVGKSTLFNTLLNKDKAIVSSIAGTTRDVVEGYINFKGIPIELLDTAGIRLTNDEIENIGILKTNEAIKNADIVVYIKENKDEKLEIENKHIIEVINKSDLMKEKDPNLLYISALNKDIKPLLDSIYKVLGISDFDLNKGSFANQRQLGLLKKSITQINEILNENNKNTPIDILIVLIHSLLKTILEIYGEAISLDLNKEIFSRFCVGK